jgi:hypothetical protein
VCRPAPPPPAPTPQSGNLLVDEAFNTKLTDFGLARVRAYTQTMTGSCGTFQWCVGYLRGFWGVCVGGGGCVGVWATKASHENG